MTLFASTWWLWGLAALPFAVVLALWCEARRRRRLARLYDRTLQGAQVHALASSARARRWGVVIVALALVVTALARPLGGETEESFVRSGRDVVFVVDVSRSMLAEDLAPNRLERAKQIVRDGLGALRGERVGILAFAGTAVVKCPLTSDTSFARLVVDELSEDSVARGGSLVGDALRTAIDSLFPEEDNGRVRDVVLISDGEDHGSFPVEAADAVAGKGARLITVGLGRTSGAPVPAAHGRQLMHEGEPVVSRLDSATLERMALTTEGGVYLPVGDGYIEFDKVYRALAESVGARGEDSDSQRTRRAELFQWPLGAAFFLLCVERGMRERR